LGDRSLSFELDYATTVISDCICARCSCENFTTEIFYCYQIHSRFWLVLVKSQLVWLQETAVKKPPIGTLNQGDESERSGTMISADAAMQLSSTRVGGNGLLLRVWELACGSCPRGVERYPVYANQSIRLIGFSRT